ncbi:hypothetical protein [Frankia sp. R43]|uniref:hypothetical protein n=1 Tax=Frankia sp. R43 TaxID=269536 RepID=UPI000ABFF0CB|nr:hypothetical protein [Frankia sp. R43]
MRRYFGNRYGLLTALVYHGVEQIMEILIGVVRQAIFCDQWMALTLAWWRRRHRDQRRM